MPFLAQTSAIVCLGLRTDFPVWVIMEIELKLLLDPADVAAFRRHPLLRRQASAKPRTQQLTSIYFDTPDGHFWQHDAALRVRRVKRDWIQTLKGGGQVAAGL